MNTIKILMLEDNPIDVAVIKKTLSKIPFQLEFTTVNSGKEFISKFNEEIYDLILCDYQLPDFTAIDALQTRNQNGSTIPFILITGAVSEEVAMAIIKEGADDYILKDRLQRLPLAVEKAIKKQKIKSEKQSAEASLSDLTQRFQLAAKTSFDVIWDYDIEKDLIYCSEAIEKIIGVTVKQNFDPAFLKQFIYPDDVPAIERSFLHIIKGKEQRWRKIFRVIRTDGSIAWINSNALVIRNKQDKAIRIIGVMHDVTEVRRLQHELVEREIQSQRQITRIALQAQEKERTEIGKELHDNVNQLLATAKIMIDTARKIPEMHDLCLTKSQESIMDAITELRNLAHSMMPPPFENSDFKDIVMDLAFKVNLTGTIELDLFLPTSEELESIDNNLKLTLYRIIQEQVSNILKHSKAKNVSIILGINGAFYTLLIEDDGIGFDPRKKSNGIGLKNIESRCALFGGTMNVTTSPGNGCIIKIQIPVKNTVHI
jgi:two-component system, NarL family, sensor histidine kinase UhpB